jgi:hypothetical protein
MLIGNQYLQLQNDKKLAIENEDYDMAKQMKNKMNELIEIVKKINIS